MSVSGHGHKRGHERDGTKISLQFPCREALGAKALLGAW